jgi:hypothetical protein
MIKNIGVGQVLLKNSLKIQETEAKLAQSYEKLASINSEIFKFDISPSTINLSGIFLTNMDFIILDIRVTVMAMLLILLLLLLFLININFYK